MPSTGVVAGPRAHLLDVGHVPALADGRNVCCVDGRSPAIRAARAAAEHVAVVDDDRRAWTGHAPEPEDVARRDFSGVAAVHKDEVWRGATARSASSGAPVGARALAHSTRFTLHSSQEERNSHLQHSSSPKRGVGDAALADGMRMGRVVLTARLAHAAGDDTGPQAALLEVAELVAAVPPAHRAARRRAARRAARARLRLRAAPEEARADAPWCARR